MDKMYKFIRWTLLTIVSVTFFSIGVMMLLGKLGVDFKAWGFPVWAPYLIGGFQVFGAVAIFYGKTVRLGIIILTALAIGSVLTQAGHHAWFELIPPWKGIIPPLILLLSLFGLMYLQAKRPEDTHRFGLL